MSEENLALLDVIWVTSGAASTAEYLGQEDAATFWHQLRAVARSRCGAVRLVCDERVAGSENLLCWQRRLRADLVSISSLHHITSICNGPERLAQATIEKIFCSDLMWRTSINFVPNAASQQAGFHSFLRVRMRQLPGRCVSKILSPWVQPFRTSTFDLVTLMKCVVASACDVVQSCLHLSSKATEPCFVRGNSLRGRNCLEPS